jgi:hypothetical protein
MLGHEGWDNEYLERITCILYLQGSDEKNPINKDNWEQVYVFVCVSSKITRRNVLKLVNNIEKLRRGYVVEIAFGENVGTGNIDSASKLITPEELLN